MVAGCLGTSSPSVGAGQTAGMPPARQGRSALLRCSGSDPKGSMRNAWRSGRHGAWWSFQGPGMASARRCRSAPVRCLLGFAGLVAKDLAPRGCHSAWLSSKQPGWGPPAVATHLRRCAGWWFAGLVAGRPASRIPTVRGRRLNRPWTARGHRFRSAPVRCRLARSRGGLAPRVAPVRARSPQQFYLRAPRRSRPTSAGACSVSSPRASGILLSTPTVPRWPKPILLQANSWYRTLV